MKTYQVVFAVLIVTEMLALLAGILNWGKVKKSYWKWFVYYLGIIVTSEITGFLLTYRFKEILLGRALYNYFVIPLEFLFFSWLFYVYFNDKRQRLVPLVGGILYFIIWIINSFFLPKALFWSVPYSYMAGVIILLVLLILFFIKIAGSDEILSYKTNMMFWVCTGLFIFFLISSPFFGLRKVLYDKYRNIFWVYYYVQFGVNYLMYIFFSISFIWGKPR